MAPASSSSVKSVSQAMDELKASKRTAFIPYICAGDPDLETTGKALQILDQVGADVIELGIPYSDPLADGPTIQSAATRALKHGTTLQGVLSMLRGVVPNIKAPVILFTYFNPIMARGLDNFCRDLKEVGVTGLLVPDLPLEETALVRQAASQHGVEVVLLTTPTTPTSRMSDIAQTSQGFVYLVSVTGVTGAKDQVNERVQGLITQLREVSQKPVAVGFGVSKPEHARTLKEWGADGVIVGSALVRELGEAATPEAGLEALRIKAQSLRDAI